MTSVRVYKVVLIGNGGVGKTTWIKRCEKGEFDGRYIATQGVDIRIMTFHTTHGIIKLNVWDCAGQEHLQGLGDGYFAQADGAIAMFDVTSRMTYKDIEQWIYLFRFAVNDAPILVVGNKCELEQKTIKNADGETVAMEADYFVSSRTNENVELPLVSLIRLMTHEPTLNIIETPVNE